MRQSHRSCQFACDILRRMGRCTHSITLAGTLVRLILTLVLLVPQLPTAMSHHDAAFEPVTLYSNLSPLPSVTLLRNAWCNADECEGPSRHECADVLSLCSQCPSGNVSCLGNNFSKLTLFARVLASPDAVVRHSFFPPAIFRPPRAS